MRASGFPDVAHGSPKTRLEKVDEGAMGTFLVANGIVKAGEVLIGDKGTIRSKPSMHTIQVRSKNDIIPMSLFSAFTHDS